MTALTQTAAKKMFGDAGNKKKAGVSEAEYSRQISLLVQLLSGEQI